VSKGRSLASSVVASVPSVPFIASRPLRCVRCARCVWLKRRLSLPLCLQWYNAYIRYYQRPLHDIRRACRYRHISIISHAAVLHSSTVSGGDCRVRLISKSHWRLSVVSAWLLTVLLRRMSVYSSRCVSFGFPSVRLLRVAGRHAT